MRTTVDIDEPAMAIARSVAAVEQISLGKAISHLVMEAIKPTSTTQGFPTFPSVPGHMITDELIAEHRDDS